jgi:hypothetical protein
LGLSFLFYFIFLYCISVAVVLVVNRITLAKCRKLEVGRCSFNLAMLICLSRLTPLYYFLKIVALKFAPQVFRHLLLHSPNHRLPMHNFQYKIQKKKRKVRKVPFDNWRAYCLPPLPGVLCLVYFSTRQEFGDNARLEKLLEMFILQDY